MVAITSNRQKAQRNGLIKVIQCLILLILLLVFTLIFHLLPAAEDQYIDQMAHDKLHLNIPHFEFGAKVKSRSGSQGDNDVEKNKEGWKTIDVFYGAHDTLLTKGRGSQCHQDRLIQALLKNKPNGFFLDLAANQAVDLSNTYKLEQNLNWTGICIEPNPIFWSQLSHRKCHIAAAVVGSKRMEKVKFRMYHDKPRRAASGGIDELIDPSIPKSDDRPEPLYTVPIIEILQKYDSPHIIDYLSLDVEGAEFMVMQVFPFDEYKFISMTVERPSQDLVNLLYSKGYRYLAGNNEDGMETAWVHQDFLDNGVVDVKAVEEVGWIGGRSTGWMEIHEGDRWKKPLVHDLRLKNGNKK